MNVPRETYNSNALHDKDLAYITEVKDYFLSKESFSLYKDYKYGFLKTFPQPLDSLSDYYKSEDYISHNDAPKSFYEKLYHLLKRINIKYKHKIISKSYAFNSILDYGCGTGDFLFYLKNKKYAVTGYEPNEKAAKITAQKIGNENISLHSIDEINQKFDVITLWHVLEHIPNLTETIEELKNHLAENGRLFIALPNYESFDAKYYKQFWAAYDVPRHLWHFSPKDFCNFINSFGMKIEATYPLWLDAFYVCILSEKYRNKNLGFLRGFIIGLISNLKAMKNGNFSSVIYEIQTKT